LEIEADADSVAVLKIVTVIRGLPVTDTVAVEVFDTEELAVFVTLVVDVFESCELCVNVTEADVLFDDSILPV